MRRQIGAWAAPIASSRFREELNTPRSPRAEDKWAGDQAAEADHADGDRREDASEAPAEDFHGEPAADRGDNEAGDAGYERRRHAARALAGKGERHAEAEQAVERRHVRD